MSADANIYDLQNVECQRLLSSWETLCNLFVLILNQKHSL